MARGERLSIEVIYIHGKCGSKERGARGVHERVVESKERGESESTREGKGERERDRRKRGRARLGSIRTGMT